MIGGRLDNDDDDDDVGRSVGESHPVALLASAPALDTPPKLWLVDSKVDMKVAQDTCQTTVLSRQLFLNEGYCLSSGTYISFQL